MPDSDRGADQHLADQWREARRALLDIADRLPESRISRLTERAGWTLKHELAGLASLDHELGHLLRAARQHSAVTIEASALRRLRGEAMHAAQELRLSSLRDQLADVGEHTARLIEEAGDALAASVTLAGQEATPLRNHLHAGIERVRTSVQVIGRHLD